MIICPHCRLDDGKFQEPTDLPWEEDGRADLKCNNCGKEYIVSAVMSIRWDTFANEDDYDMR
jgi:hypothetical protein